MSTSESTTEKAINLTCNAGLHSYCKRGMHCECSCHYDYAVASHRVRDKETIVFTVGYEVWSHTVTDEARIPVEQIDVLLEASFKFISEDERPDEQTRMSLAQECFRYAEEDAWSRMDFMALVGHLLK